MPVTVFEYNPRFRLPLVPAVLIYRDEAITEAGPLYFAVDSAATHTVVTPQCEAQLKVARPDIPWENLFKRRAVEIDTILGPAVFKALSGGVGLAFLTAEKKPWIVRLEFVLFSDIRVPRPREKVVAATQYPFGILGQDVLRQCGIVSTPEGGFLTSDRKVTGELLRFYRRHADS
jgi:hypothetical protein